MFRLLLIPLGVILLLAGLAYRVDEVRGYQTLPVYTCLAADVSSPLGADVLFIGSSRTGAAIDPVYIERILAQRHGITKSVYRINSHGTDHVFYWLMARAYLENNPAPETVFIESLVSVKGNGDFYEHLWQRPKGLPYVTPKSFMLGDALAYAELLSHENAAGLTEYVDRRRISTADFVGKKFVTALYHLIMDPVKALAGSARSCNESPEWRRSGGQWLHDTLDGTSLEDVYLDQALQQTDKFRQAMDTLQQRKIDASGRDYEVDMLMEIVALFQNAGTRNIALYELPSYKHGEISTEQRAAYEKRFPGVEILFIGDLYAQPGYERLEEMFRDPHHFNASGASRVSAFFADQLGADND